MTEYLTTEDLYAINAYHLGGKALVRDAGQVGAAAFRPSTEAFGEVAYPTLIDKAAALLHSIACGLPFMDGNKRTAWHACILFLELNDAPLTYTQDAAFDLVLWVAASPPEVLEIAQRLAPMVNQ